MTAVAWDGKTLAADSCASGDTVLQGGVRKLHKAGDKIVGFCGTLEDGLSFVEWARAGYPPSKKPKVDNDFNALSISRQNNRKTPKVTEYGPKLIGYPVRGPVAIGSGGAAALGAMLAGADAVSAVKIACRVDGYCRPPVHRLGIV